MRFFFFCRQFKIIVSVVVILIAVAAVFALIGGRMTPGADLLASVTAPFRSAATAISETVSDFFTATRDGEKLMMENAELEQELDELREKFVDYEKTKEENEEYKK